MAHELGHVLLAEKSHARKELKSPRFSRQDLVLDKQATRLRELLEKSDTR